jgi:hypothetical protein
VFSIDGTSPRVNIWTVHRAHESQKQKIYRETNLLTVQSTVLSSSMSILAIQRIEIHPMSVRCTQQQTVPGLTLRCCRTNHSGGILFERVIRDVQESRAVPSHFLSWDVTEAMRPLGCRVVALTAFNMYYTIRKNLKNCCWVFLAKKEITFLATSVQLLISIFLYYGKQKKKKKIDICKSLGVRK